MSRYDRRAFLVGSGSLVVAAASAQGQADRKPSPPPPPTRLPENWLSAPSLPIWPGKMPGTGFKSQTLPANWSPVFLRNVAQPELRVFRAAKPNGHALLVVPGGAYQFVSVANEGAELAPLMTAGGITVFVLVYRLPGEGWQNRSDIPLQDAQRAIRFIQANAARYNVDSRKVSVLGFSAGGHLAATLSTQHAERTHDAIDSTDSLSARPFSTGLVYPVITMEKRWTHEMSRNLLLGETPSDAEVARRSPERHVDAATPPTFLVHAMDDEAVPVENSLRMMEAMRAAKRPIEAHLLQEGGHAFGVGRPNTVSARWIELYTAWLARLS